MTGRDKRLANGSPGGRVGTSKAKPGLGLNQARLDAF